MNNNAIHVLSIEDNPADAFLIQEKLAEAQHIGWNLPSFEIEHVSRLQTALARLGEAEYDVVLTDLDLPDSRAEETVATLREHIPHMPLVVLTGREDEMLARKSVRAGVQDYLYKNEATGSLLARTLMYALERHQIHAGLEQRVVERTAALKQSNEDLRRANRALAAEIAERKRVEEALQQSEQRFRTIVDVLPQFVAYTDKDLTYRFVNRTYLERFGVALEEILGKTLPEVIGEGTLARARPHVERVLRGERVRYHEHYDYVLGDPLDIDGVLIPDVAEDGEVHGYYSVLTDITPYMEAQEALRANEARYRRLLDTLQEGVWVIDAEGYTSFVNPKMAQMLGYEMEAMQGRHLFEFMSEANVEIARRKLGRRRQGVREQHEFRLLHRGGHPVYVLMETAPILDEEGEYQGAIAGVVDITDRKRTEKVTEARLRIAAASTTESSEALMQMTLDEIEALTGSAIGFYHFLNPDQETLTLQTWSTHTLEQMCTAEGQGRHYPVSEAGVWVDCVRQRQPVIHNDYAVLSHRRGMPPGHAPIVRELVVPIMRNDSIVAILGVGNKPTDYTDLDVEIALLLGDFSWEIVTRKRVEEALRERLKELNCLYAVSHYMQESLPLAEICRRVIKDLVPAMRYPELAAPVIEIDGQRFTHERYTGELSHALQAEIEVKGDTRGWVRVYYAGDRDFLIPEEQDLVEAIAGGLGQWLEHKKT